MTLHDVAAAFIGGWTTTRRLSGPFEVAARQETSWLHDPTGRRMGELVGVDSAPERLVELYPRGQRGAISALYGVGTDLEPHRRVFRSLGWRLLRTEPAFVHHLRVLPPLDGRIRRALTDEEVARVAKAARMKPATMGVENHDDASIRLYEAVVNRAHAGWVRSISVPPDAWVSSLVVQPPFRRQGLGHGLMAALLHDDARLGRRSSVLLASHTGALLYPRLGYERVGTLMLFMPIKEKAP